MMYSDTALDVAVLFDLDGTLVDSQGAETLALQRFAAQLGGEISTAKVVDLAAGRRMQEAIDILCAHINGGAAVGVGLWPVAKWTIAIPAGPEVTVPKRVFPHPATGSWFGAPHRYRQHRSAVGRGGGQPTRVVRGT